MNNIIEKCRNQTKKIIIEVIGRVPSRSGKLRCQNYLGKFDRCWNRASKLAIIQEEQQPLQRQEEGKDKTLTRQQEQQQQKRRIWICEECFKLRLLNDKKFTDQLLQVTNLSKNKNDDID